MQRVARSPSTRCTAAVWLIGLVCACAPVDINGQDGMAGRGPDLGVGGQGGSTDSIDGNAGTAGSSGAGSGATGGAAGSGTGGSGAAGSGANGGSSGSGAAGSGAADSGAAGAGGDWDGDSGGGDAGEPGDAGSSGDSSVEPTGPTVTTNLFSALLGTSQEEVDAKLTLAVERVFGVGTGEPNLPTVASGYRLYYELPQDPGKAFIWAPDSTDIRSEGMSYGMMIAVQMDMQLQFDRLWAFAQAFMQYPSDSVVEPWRHYFRWKGTVNTQNASSWVVNYNATEGPAPDGEEYFAAALYLAHRRWGSDGAVNYLAHANTLADAMLNNPTDDDARTPVFRQDNDMVVFYPHGSSANFSDPSYHLPAFYEVFALDGPEADRARWREIAEVSRQYLVTSAHATTGLHPDYANFDGTPNTGGSDHHMFRYDAWRVVMNMALDYAWFSSDSRLKTQVEKYHAFFSTRLVEDNVQNALFALDGSSASGGGSTALTATLAAGALASEHAIRTELVDNLWNVQQQSGTYRYYQQTVYLLGLLCTSGRFAYDWPD